MKKKIFSILLCFTVTQNFAQAQRKITTYLFTQYNKTIYDKTLGNNRWGIGLGVQALFNNKTKFKPTIELTGDIYIVDDKVLRTNTDGTEIKSVHAMINIFLGTSFNATQNIFLSFVAGPSFISGQTLLGIKPSLGLYFPKNQRWTGKLSYINVFNRGKNPTKDFGSISFGIGVRL